MFLYGKLKHEKFTTTVIYIHILWSKYIKSFLWFDTSELLFDYEVGPVDWPRLIVGKLMWIYFSGARLHLKIYVILEN